MIKNLLITIILILFFSCASFLEIFDDKLHLKNELIDSNPLKLNGFYYYNHNGYIYDIIFFFKNGIILDCVSPDGDILNSEKYIIREFLKNKEIQFGKENWGIYSIKGDSIFIEKWYQSEISKCYVSSGIILNDSTFRITEKYRMRRDKKKEITNINEVYRFRKFMNKPDSTNNFIK